MDIKEMKRRFIERLISNPNYLDDLLKHIQEAEKEDGVIYGQFEVEDSEEIEDNTQNDGMV